MAQYSLVRSCNHDKRHRQGQMARGIDQSPHNTVATSLNMGHDLRYIDFWTSTKAPLVINHKRARSIIRNSKQILVLDDLHDQGQGHIVFRFLASVLQNCFYFKPF